MSMKKMLAVVAASACVAFAAPAFAANPFSDVPMHHWAYDAVDVLAAHGVVQGYPDGTFKGNKPITRYEMSMIIARAMSAGALSGEDNALLKRLIVEFKDELDSLGVRVDNLEGRVNALEGGLEGWKVSGTLGMKATWGKDATGKKDSGVGFNKFEINLDRNITDKVKFHATLAPTKGIKLTDKESNVTRDYKVESPLSVIGFKNFYVTVSDFYFGTKLTAGKFGMSFEGDAGLDAGLGSIVYDDTSFGVKLEKDFGLGSLTAYAGTDKVYTARKGDESKELYKDWLYGLRFAMTPAERFSLGLNAWFNLADKTNTYFVDAGYSFADGFELKGAYYYQTFEVAGKDDSASAYRAILSVDAEKLGGFTSLTAEYLKAEKGFHTYTEFAEDVLQGVILTNDVHGWFIGGEQGWNDKIDSYFNFGSLTAEGENGGSDLTFRHWDVGVNYKYNPYLKFGLEYGSDKLTGEKAHGRLTFKTTFKF